ncbi:MAG: hypothetical protein QF415_15445 [Candidatus Undinarchaeales archaeon]|jgi:hypothetical protein|nr:hypothetical protein [Candidatus Undinarchaeales archaeon]MDP7493964.1 hypothetical protein [Candidatus Undinarchaeales archaeon]
MYLENERVHMPYEDKVSGDTCEFLDAIGGAVASNNGMQNVYAGTETSISYSLMRGSGTMHESGVSEHDLLNTLSTVEDQCDELGIHAQVEGYLTLIGFGPGYKFVQRENVSKEALSAGPNTVTRNTDTLSVTIQAYGCLPGDLVGNLDALEDISGIQQTAARLDTKTVVYDLLADLSSYSNTSGNTAVVLGLDDPGLYQQLDQMVEEEQVTRTQKVQDSFLAKVPFFGGLYVKYQMANLEEQLAVKQAAIDQLQDTFTS